MSDAAGRLVAPDSPAPLDRQPAPALSRATVDRAAEHRTDTVWLSDAWRTRGRLLALDAENRVLVGHPAPEPGGASGPRGASRPGGASEQDGPSEPGRASGQREAPRPELHLLPTAGELPEDCIFLGQDADAAYFAQRVELLPVPPEARTATLREIGSDLGDRDAGLLVHAVALLTWLDRSAHCPRCGALTEVRAAGSLRVCPVDGTEHHPRTDPAMIVLVTSPDGERAVLARNLGWPEGLYSCLAGFVEPGESAEQCVVREVVEEVGLTASELRYTGSQPWPFPSSLMLAYTATTSDEEIRIEEDEIAAARWFGRDELRQALAEGTVWAPPAVSIARRLIDAWLAEGES